MRCVVLPYKIETIRLTEFGSIKEIEWKRVTPDVTVVFDETFYLRIEKSEDVRPGAPPRIVTPAEDFKTEMWGILGGLYNSMLRLSSEAVEYKKVSHNITSLLVNYYSQGYILREVPMKKTRLAPVYRKIPGDPRFDIYWKKLNEL
jgi:hypothetical protein